MLKLHLHIFLKGAFNTSTQVNIDLVQLIVFYLYKQKYINNILVVKKLIVIKSSPIFLTPRSHLVPIRGPSPLVGQAQFFFYLYVLILSLTETTFIFSQLTK